MSEGGIRPLIGLMGSGNVEVQRQSTKAIANLAVNADNKTKIVAEGALPAILALAKDSAEAVRCEAIAALANLAVNDENEARPGSRSCFCSGSGYITAA